MIKVLSTYLLKALLRSQTCKYYSKISIINLVLKCISITNSLSDLPLSYSEYMLLFILKYLFLLNIL